jgi:hypothetical protein
VLAEPAKRTYEVEYVWQGSCHRILDVCHQVGQPVVRQVELLEIQAGMAVSEPGGHLPQADVSDVDAAAYSFGVPELFRHLDEPSAIQSGGVLEENQRTIWPLAEAGIQLTHPGEQTIRLGTHLTLVVNDEAGDAAREAVGEFLYQRAVPPMQHVDAAVQMDDGQGRMGRYEPQDMLELIWRFGVDLGACAHLGEAEPGEPEQRLIAADALLEQGVNAARRLADISSMHKLQLHGVQTVFLLSHPRPG